MPNNPFFPIAPPEFQGLRSDLPIEVYYRHLPHWRQQGATYAVTFRLADALPREKIQQLQHWRDYWERTHEPPRSDKDWQEFASQINRQTEAWVDEGYGACHLRDPVFARTMADAFVYFQDQRSLTFCFCVMPNHCHVVVKPLEGFPLEDLLASWKGYVAFRINRARGQHGLIWEQESYDRIIRDEEHLMQVIQYIGQNPLKAQLPNSEWYRWVHPEWEKAGWGFRDQ